MFAGTMTQRSVRLGSYAACAMALVGFCPPASAANFRSFTFTASVDGPSSSLGGSLSGLVSDGDTITGYFTFDLDEPDDLGGPLAGRYSHVAGPASLYAAVNGVVFRTNPAAVSVDVIIFNDTDEAYAITSNNNLAGMGVGAPNIFDFQLERVGAGDVLTSDAQPTSPPNVLDFDPFSPMGTRLVIEQVGDYAIVAELLSIDSNDVVDNDGFATSFDCDAPTAVCFSTISAAIAALPSGSLIEVCPGTYVEDIEFPLGKDGMELAAKDPAPANTVIKGVANVASASFPLAVPNVHILADAIFIHGFTIQGPDPVAGFYSSGTVIGGDLVELADNAFEVTNAATLADISQGIQTYRDGINPGGGSVDGLWIHDNTFSHHGAGVAGYEAIFINHTLTDPTPAGSVTIESNVLSGMLLRGITSERSKTVVRRNQISTTLAPDTGGGLTDGESLQAVNIMDFDARDQQDVTIEENALGVPAAPPPATLIITGVIDGPISGGLPKAVELYATGAIPDLSIYGLGSANNGAASPGEEFGFPAGSASAGQFIYIATESSGFSTWFGFPPTHTNGTAPNINGDDVIELFENGNVIDVFGVLGLDGTGEPWEYTDGWAYRNSGTGPDGTTFILGNWSFSGVTALDDDEFNTNATATPPMPIGSYAPAAPGSGFTHGVRVGNSAGTQLLTNVSITNNFINGNHVGVLVRASGGGITVFENDLSGNTSLGADNTHATDLNASGNWWGDNTPASTAAATGANVDYTPWLHVGTDVGGVAADGFQGDFATLHVDDDGPQTGLAGRIQEGIDLVTASTVLVEAGTYLESDISVNKSVTIDGNGATRADVVIAPSVADDHTCSSFAGDAHHGFLLRSSDTLIRDLTIDGDAGFGGPGSLNFRQGIISDFNDANHPFNNNAADNVAIRNIWRRGFYWLGGTGHAITNFAAENCGVNCFEGCNVIFLDGDGDETTLDILIDNGVIDGGTTGICTNYTLVPVGDFNPRVEITEVDVLDTFVGMNLSGLSGDSLVDGNTIVGLPSDDDLGIVVQYALDSVTAHPGTVTLSNNVIDDCDQGIWLYHNEEADTPILVKDNDIAGPSTFAASVGIFMTDDGAPFTDEDAESYATISGNTIHGFETGIFMNRAGDAPAGGRDIVATIGGVGPSDGNSVKFGSTGVLVFDADGSASGYRARATILNNITSFTVNAVGIEVDGGSALLERNNLSGNTLAGLVVRNDGLVDAGDVDGADVTGLGSGTGLNGSSAGLNFLAGYNGTSTFAVIDENLDAAGNVDVQAESNFWGTIVLSEIEDVVDHTVDDAAQTLVLFDNPVSVPELVITAPAVCQNNGPTQVSVTLSMRNLPLAVHGYFATVEYDTATLSYNQAASAYLFEAVSEFPIHLGGPEPVEVSPGLIEANAARNLVPPNPGTDQDTDLATLVFDVIGCGSTTVGFGTPQGPFPSQVSFQGIGLSTDLVEDSFLIDTGNAPTITSAIATGGAAGPTCAQLVTLSAVVSDDCCIDLLNGAVVTASAAVTAGTASLSGESYNIVQSVAPNTVEITGSVTATLLNSCAATITFTINATDCCGNALTPAHTVDAVVEDISDPVFTTLPGALDVTIECDESLEPGILLGVTSPASGIAVYYNDNGLGENGDTNVAYFRAQTSYGNTNGAPFTFDTAALTGFGPLTWAGLFGQSAPTQFGLDFVLPAPTYDFSVSLPALTAYENFDNNILNRIAVGSITWAINDYKGGSPNGPANPATDVINSLLRSATPGNPLVDVTDVSISVSQAGPIFTANISGKFVSDDIIHWFTVGQPDSPTSNYSMDGDYYFSGTLTYDSTGDAGTDLIDFYSGSLTISANSPNTALGFPLAVDNCTLFPVITFSDMSTPGADCSVDQVVEVITRTWTATDDCGNDAQYIQTITVQDTTPPVVTDPADIVVVADAGGCDAFVTVPPLSATDNCSALTIVNSHTGTSDASGVYPQGTTNVTWTVTDACGNQSVVQHDVTVQALNEVQLTVKLADVQHSSLPANTPLSFSRNIRFIVKDGADCATEVCEMVTFTGNDGDTPTANVSFFVECGPWVDVCAKDDQLTIYDTVGLSVAGPVFVGSTDIELRGGDTDNDSDVDINDVTYFLFRFGSLSAGLNACPFDGTRDADFSLNGAIAGEDFTILQGNWLEVTSCVCAPPFVEDPAIPPVRDPRRPSKRIRTRLAVAELTPEIARKVDLNRDGTVDYRDVALFEQRHGFATDLSRAMLETETRGGSLDAGPGADDSVGRR